MSHEADDQRTEPGPESGSATGWNRFLATTLGFLGYESLLIVVFGDYFYPGVSSELGVWVMVGLAAVGYLALGAFTRSPVSMLVFFLPVLIAVTLDPPVPADAWGGEFAPFYVRWLYMSIVFLPAWAVGIIVSFRTRRKEAGNR